MKEFLGGLLGQNMKIHVERKNKVNWNRKNRFALLPPTIRLWNKHAKVRKPIDQFRYNKKFIFCCKAWGMKQKK